MLQFGKQLQEIIDVYKDGTNDPLNGDDVNSLTHILNCQLNLMEGNITDNEYDELLDKRWT